MQNLDERRGRFAMQTMSRQIADLLIDHVPAGVAIFDRDMRYLACSPRWLENLGLAGKDLFGLSHYDVVPETSCQRRELHRRGLAGETLSAELDRFQRTDGSVDWVNWELVPWFDDAGEIGGIVIFSEVVSRDVERRGRTRAILEELNLLIDSAAHHAIFMLDPEGCVMIWNAGAERLYGFNEAEVLGRSFEMFFREEDRADGLPVRKLAEARETGSCHSRSWRERKDGSLFLAEATIGRILGDDGEIIGFGQVVRDVTEEDARAHELEARAVHLRSILETVPDAMVVIGEDGIVQSFSKAAEAMFGYTASEVVGRNVSMLMPSPDREKHDDYIARYNRTHERSILGTNRRVLGQRKDGTTFPHELSVGEAYGGGKRVFTGFLRDLTEREEATARLQEIQAELLHISRVSAVGTMATALAHELNQPLMAIANYVQGSAVLLSSERTDAVELVRGALGDAGKEALRAGKIIRRLREFVARGELERTIEAPGKLVAQARTLAAIGAAAGGIECRVIVDEHAAPVLVDAVQIQQVLLNLIRNALDALNSRGTIEIRVAPEGPGATRFTVADDGPGVSPEHEASLFDSFASTKAHGMGLGLSICRTIVEAHGGRLWYETAKGGGAAFSFTLPAVDLEGQP